jgi:hypothetical protein
VLAFFFGPRPSGNGTGQPFCPESTRLTGLKHQKVFGFKERSQGISRIVHKREVDARYAAGNLIYES